MPKDIIAKTWVIQPSYDGKRWSEWPNGNKPTPGGDVSTYFDSLYTPGWTPNSGTNVIAQPSLPKPAKTTDILTGGYTDPNFGTQIRRITSTAEIPGGTPSHVRHEYSRRQAFNADSSRFIAITSQSWWYLYDANTTQLINGGRTQAGPGNQAISFLAGQCEPIWHPTDPNKLWYFSGLVWYELTFNTWGQAPTQTVLFDLTPKLAALGAPWNTAELAWFQFEGRPSDDGRWWCLAIERVPGDPINIGVIMYDRQTDTITGAVPTSGRRPNNVTTSPLGNYMVLSYYGSAQGSIAAEQAQGFANAAGLWTFNRDGSFHRVLSVLGEHSDCAVDAEGNEIYVSISYRGFADHGGADGIWFRRMDNGTAWVLPVMSGGGAGATSAYSQGAYHMSGVATKRRGWITVSTYGGGSGAFAEMVCAVELKPVSPRVFRLAHRQGANSTYFAETHACPSPDFTRVLFVSDFRTGTTPFESYQICLPSGALPST